MDIASLGLEIRSDGVVVASDRLNRFGQDAARAARETEALSASFRRFAPIIGTVTAAFSVRALQNYADQWSDMQSRVGAAIKNMEAAPALMQRIQDIANASYSPMAQTVEIYSRNVSVLSELGRGTKEAADFTESLNHMLVLTATRGERAAAVQNALSKAMAVGRLGGQELETVMANGGRVAEALAKELGTTVNGLRGLASQGKITGQVIASAIINPLEEVRKAAGEMPATIGDAMTRIQTNFLGLVGRVDQATGSSQNFAAMMLGLADRIGQATDNAVRLAVTIQTLARDAIDPLLGMISNMTGGLDGVSIAIMAASGAGAALALVVGKTLVSSFLALNAAILANPIGLLVTAFGAALAAAYMFRDETAKVLGVDLIAFIKETGNDIIGVFVGAYRAVVAIWKILPDEFRSIGKLAANALLESLGSINIDFTNPFTGNKTRLLGFDFKDLKFQVDEVEKGIEGMARSAFQSGQGVNYLGAAFGRVREAWNSVGDVRKAFEDIGSAGGKAAETLDPKLAEAYRKIVDGAKQFIAEQELEARVIGFTEQEANRLRYELELLNKAKEAGIPLTAARTSELQGLAAQMAESEARTKALTDAFDFAKQTSHGFFSDLNRGIQQGKSIWESFGNAATNALNRISDKLIQMAVDGLWQSAFPGGGGNFLGMLGGLFGGGGFAGTMGGMAGVLAPIHHSGGIVGGPAPLRLVGSDIFANAPRYHKGGIAGLGPNEVPAILERGERIIPRGASDAVAEPVRVHVTVGWSRSADGNLKPFVEEVSTRAAGSVVDRAAPGIVKASVASSEAQISSKMRANNVRGTRW